MKQITTNERCSENVLRYFRGSKNIFLNIKKEKRLHKITFCVYKQQEPRAASLWQKYDDAFRDGKKEKSKKHESKSKQKPLARARNINYDRVLTGFRLSFHRYNSLTFQANGCIN